MKQGPKDNLKAFMGSAGTSEERWWWRRMLWLIIDSERGSMLHLHPVPAHLSERKLWGVHAHAVSCNLEQETAAAITPLYCSDNFGFEVCVCGGESRGEGVRESDWLLFDFTVWLEPHSDSLYAPPELIFLELPYNILVQSPPCLDFTQCWCEFSQTCRHKKIQTERHRILYIPAHNQYHCFYKPLAVFLKKDYQ